MRRRAEVLCIVLNAVLGREGTRADFCAFCESNLIVFGTRRSTLLLRALGAPISKMNSREFSVSCRSNFRTKHRH